MVSRVAEGGPASKSEGLKMNDEIIKVRFYSRESTIPSAGLYFLLSLSLRSNYMSHTFLK